MENGYFMYIYENVIEIYKIINIKIKYKKYTFSLYFKCKIANVTYPLKGANVHRCRGDKSAVKPKLFIEDKVLKLDALRGLSSGSWFQYVCTERCE